MTESVKYIFEKDLMVRQQEAEQVILEEFNIGAYTFDDPMIRVNPYLINPCAALVLFRTEKETAVTVTVRGRTPKTDITHTFPPAREHILPVLGLYPGDSNTVELTINKGRTKTLIIETSPADGAAELLHIETAAGYREDGLIVLAPAGFGRLTGFDSAGDIRWFISAGLQMGVKRLKNGRLLVGSERLIRPPYYSTGLREMDMTGKITAEYRLPGGYHHDQAELPDGNLLVLTDDFSAESHTVEDICALVDRETGAVIKTWDFKTFLTPGEGASGLATDEDWFHCNAVWYDAATRSLTFSGRHVDALVNIDFDTGALRWILGDPEGWPEDKRKYFFTPDGDGFSWQYAQHACLVTPGGDVMCFDNGTLRSKNKDKYLANKDNYSRGVRFHIDTGNMTIRKVWEYGRERGPAFFSQHISNVDYFGEGHYLVHSGGIMQEDGVPIEGLKLPGPDNKVVSECVTVELINDTVVMEMKCKSNYYRALKLPLYGDGAGFGAPGQMLGRLAPTTIADDPSPLNFSGALLPGDCLGHIIEESDRICLKARFEADTRVYLLLCQGETTRAYPVNTSDKFAQFAGLPHLESDPRNTATTINKQGLCGVYDVRISIDGEAYETGVTVSC